MKTKPGATEPLYINLYNLDSTPAQESPYVLTSPRSLQACRQAGLKPVELLYKDLQEYQEDLEGVSAEKVFQLYTIHEQDRKNNLNKCRAIRKDLTLKKDAINVLKENARPVKNEETEKYREALSRKAQLDKENTSRAKATGSASLIVQRKICPIPCNLVSDYDETNCERILHLTGGGAGTPTSEKSYTKKRVSTSGSDRSRINTLSNKKSYGYSNRFPAVPIFTSPLPTSSPECSTLSSSSTARHLNARRSPSRLKVKSKFGDPYKCKDAAKKARSSSGDRVRPINLGNTATLREKSYKCRSGNGNKCQEKFDSNNNSSCGSSGTVSALGQHRRKHVSFRYMRCTDDLFLSEHDRRILESMALKKEAERESQEIAYQAQRLWEMDREHREQLNQAHESEWKEYVAEKRRYESERNAKKWEEMKTSLRRSQWLLEKSLREKDEKSAKLRKQVEEQKLLELEDRSLLAAKRRAVVDAANYKLDMEAAMWQHSLDRQQKEKLERAQNTRNKQRETYRKRVASANRAEELRHQDRWQQVREETESALSDLRELCRLRESKAQKKHDEIIHSRDLHIKEQSLERELKFQQAQHLQEELDQGLERWRRQVSALQGEATLRAGCSAARQREAKRHRVEADNRARELQHRRLMDSVCREDEARLKYVRNLITRKEEKMRRMAHNRDVALQESRIQAHTTAELREHIRRTLSPETFDRKVARVALEMRVTSRPPTASPTMNRSHIFLG